MVKLESRTVPLPFYLVLLPLPNSTNARVLIIFTLMVSRIGTRSRPIMVCLLMKLSESFPLPCKTCRSISIMRRGRHVNSILPTTITSWVVLMEQGKAHSSQLFRMRCILSFSQCLVAGGDATTIMAMMRISIKIHLSLLFGIPKARLSLFSLNR